MAELLILGPSVWKSRLDRFARYKNDTGLPATVLTLDQISGSYSGTDQPEKVKRCIEEYRRLDGTRYVLLAGDADRFPVRYIKAINTEWGTKWYPSDLYYEDLYDKNGAFDDWDADGDGIHAEVDFANRDKPIQFNIDKINIIPDVAVGRVPASSDEEIERYFKKVTDYEFAARESTCYSHPSPWARKALFIGGGDGFGDKSISNAHAVPLAQSGISVITRYIDDLPWNAPGVDRPAEVRAILDQGVGFLHYYGHGNVGAFSGWLGLNDVRQLDNEHALPVVVAVSCYTARFHYDLNDYLTILGSHWAGTSKIADRPRPHPVQPTGCDKDSMAEEFLVKDTTGGIAYLGSVDPFEHGGKPLALYLFEAYKDLSKPPVLGDMWKTALTRFACNEVGSGLIGMGPYFAFIHVHKVMLFGDPSLRVGGLQRSGPHTDGKGMPVSTMEAALGGTA
jgi:hypothetical protein